MVSSIFVYVSLLVKIFTFRQNGPRSVWQVFFLPAKMSTCGFYLNSLMLELQEIHAVQLLREHKAKRAAIQLLKHW